MFKAKLISSDLWYWLFKDSSRLQIHSFALSINIFASSVFCSNKHKKNFDIHFSNKRQAWRMSRLLRRLFWIAPCCVFKNRYFIAKNRTMLIKYKYKDWILLVCFSWRNEGQRIHCKFRKALRALRNLHVDPLSFIPRWETNKKNSIPM